MFFSEIYKILGIERKTVKYAFKAAAENNQSIVDKVENGEDLSLDECIEIVSKIDRSNLMVEYLKENYIKNNIKKSDGYYIEGTCDFLDRFSKNPKVKCCNTCDAIIGKIDTNSSIPKPFCSVYNRYLRSFNANVYLDWCSSYKYKRTEAKMWLKSDSPTNINIYGNTDKVNGIKRSRFCSSENSNNEHVNIIDKIGFY